MTEFFDKDLKPLTMQQWAQLLEDPSYRQVAYDEASGTVVSTIWLGMALTAADRRLFETATFKGTHGPLTEERSATLAEALEAHRATLATLRP